MPEQLKIMMVAVGKGGSLAELPLSYDTIIPGLLQFLLQHPPHIVVLVQKLLQHQAPCTSTLQFAAFVI